MIFMKDKKMRILAASDFHGNEIVSKDLAKKAEKEKADLVVIAGDILDFGGYAKNMIKPFVEREETVVFVPGNHDTEEATESFVKNYKIKNLDGSYLIIGNVGFFGCGGSTMPMFSYYLTENEIYYRLKTGFEKIKDKKKKVMVTHMHPAKSTIEKFSFPGSMGIKKAIERFTPDILICGHIHEMEGLEEVIGKTKVFAVGKRGTIIDI